MGREAGGIMADSVIEEFRGMLPALCADVGCDSIEAANVSGRYIGVKFSAGGIEAVTACEVLDSAPEMVAALRRCIVTSIEATRPYEAPTADPAPAVVEPAPDGGNGW